MPNPDNIKKLYDYLQTKGAYSKDEKSFSDGINTEEGRKKLFDYMTQKGYYSKDYNEFNTGLGYGSDEAPTTTTTTPAPANNAVESQKQTVNNGTNNPAAAAMQTKEKSTGKANTVVASPTPASQNPDGEAPGMETAATPVMAEESIMTTQNAANDTKPAAASTMATGGATEGEALPEGTASNDLYKTYEESNPDYLKRKATATPEELAKMEQERQIYEGLQAEKRKEARKTPVRQFYKTYMKPVFDKVREKAKQLITEAISPEEKTQRLMGSPTMAVSTQRQWAKEKYDDPQKVIDEVLNQFMPVNSDVLSKDKNRTSDYETARRQRNSRILTQLVYDQIGMNPDETEKNENQGLHDLYNTWVQAGLKLGDEDTFLKNIKDKKWREAFYNENLKGRVQFSLDEFNNEIDPPQ